MTEPAEGTGRHRADDVVETIRSEERVVIGTTTRVSGRVRLERIVVEEERTITVRLRREQVRAVPVEADGTEVVPQDPGARATPWVVVHEEQPVISTIVVPVERVRLVVVPVSGSSQQTVDVSREVVDVVDGSGTALD